MNVTSSTDAFRVRGVRNGSVVTVSWKRGVLGGDPPTLDLIEVEAELAALAVGDRCAERGGAHTISPTADPLTRADTTLALIRRVVDRVTRITVDAPESELT